MIVGLSTAIDGTARYDDVPHKLLAHAADVATAGFAAVAYNDAGLVCSFTACAELGAADATPPGWWIVFSYTRPAYRRGGIGTTVLLEAFDVLAPIWPVFVRQGRGRDLVWSGRFGYEVAPDQNWQLLKMRPGNHYRLYHHPE